MLDPKHNAWFLNTILDAQCWVPGSRTHLLAITSLAFMLDCVPDPVCQITSGK